MDKRKPPKKAPPKGAGKGVTAKAKPRKAGELSDEQLGKVSGGYSFIAKKSP